MIRDATETTTLDEINQISDKKRVLLAFKSPTCGPCRKLVPILEEADKEAGDDAEIIKVDVTVNPVLATQFHVDTVPFLTVVENRSVLCQSLGFRSKQDIINLLKF